MVMNSLQILTLEVPKFAVFSICPIPSALLNTAHLPLQVSEKF